MIETATPDGPATARPAHRIVFANEKGGTGKSTTAVHIGVALAYLLKVPYAAGAFFSGMLAALAMALWPAIAAFRRTLADGLTIRV
jgi:Mrp family chromosome partitioning ATPase